MKSWIVAICLAAVVITGGVATSNWMRSEAVYRACAQGSGQTAAERAAYEECVWLSARLFFDEGYIYVDPKPRELPAVPPDNPFAQLDPSNQLVRPIPRPSTGQEDAERAFLASRRFTPHPSSVLDGQCPNHWSYPPMPHVFVVRFYQERGGVSFWNGALGAKAMIHQAYSQTFPDCRSGRERLGLERDADWRPFIRGMLNIGR